jgi:DNA polymerase-3 subunit epsilon
MKKVFLDTETTGFAPGQIGQLSMIIEEDNGEVEAKNYFFDIDYITPGAQEACGRDLDFYKQASNGKKFADYATEIYDILKDAMIVAHNEKFDENFLSTEFWRQNILFTPAARFDTMTYFVNICKLPGRNGKYKNPKLEELVDTFSIDKEKVGKYSIQLFGNDDSTNKGFHDARYDTTSMYVAFRVYGDVVNETNSWMNAFCK